MLVCRLYAERTSQLDRRLYELHSGADGEYKARLNQFESDRSATLELIRGLFANWPFLQRRELNSLCCVFLPCYICWFGDFRGIYILRTVWYSHSVINVQELRLIRLFRNALLSSLSN